MELREDQKQVVEVIKRTAERYEAVFFQAPTGWGKTATAVALADYFRGKGKNVIIATVRNDLVSQFYQTVSEMKSIEEKPEVTVGRSNYIMLDRAVESLRGIKNRLEPDEYGRVMDFLLEEKKNGGKYVFASDVERKHAAIADTDAWVLVKLLAAATQGDDIPTLCDTPYAVTNVFYLIFHLLYSKEKLANTVILLDEVDYFAESVRNFFFTGFSLHSLKVMASHVYFQTGEEIYDRLAEKAESARNRARALTGYEKGENIVGELCEILGKLFPEAFLKKILEFGATNGKSEVVEQVRELRRFIREVKARGPETLVKQGLYRVDFSPINKYPRVIRQEKSPEDARNSLRSLWRIMTEDANRVVGMGATVFPDFRNEANRAEILGEIQDILTLPGGLRYIFIPVTDIIEIEPRNVVVYIAEEDAPHFVCKPPDDIQTRKWIEYVADVIERTYIRGSKAMVICKARETSQLIARELIKRGLDVVYDKAADMKMALSAFLNKENGGILVAHSGLGVGMDVPDIKQLYVVQLPFPVPPVPKILRGNMKRDFVQWTGRLRSDPEEVKELYILDSRINKKGKDIASIRYELRKYYREVKYLSVSDDAGVIGD